MNKFNVGDRVRVVKCDYRENEELFPGAVGTVREIIGDGYGYAVEIDRFRLPNNNLGWTYYAEELEPE